MLAQRGSEAVAEELDRTENPTTDEKEEVLSEEQIETTQKDEEQASMGTSESDETGASIHLSCLTVQPNRVRCGVRGEKFCIDLRMLLWILNNEYFFSYNNCISLYFLKEAEKLFIIFTHKVDDQSTLEVEFSTEKGDAQRVAGTLENEYTISVSAPGKYHHGSMGPK